MMLHKQLLPLLVLLGVLPTVGFAQSPTPPLNFGNNFLVTGDYVVAGAYNMTTKFQTIGNASYAVGTINVPDGNQGITGTKQVPKGGQIVAALLYWQTVEKVGVAPGAAGSGQNGFFKPLLNASSFPATFPGYAISGTNLNGSNTVSWSSGGCGGGSTGKLLRTYRADVGGALPLDGGGNPTANGTFEVRLPSSGNSTPLTLGATLVIIYRIPAGAGGPSVPLNAIVIYDGDYSQSNTQLSMTQNLQGFYDADDNTVSRLTHIVGSGQSNKFQTVYLGSGNPLTKLPSLYGSKPPFPGSYGTWDNPTWTFLSGSPITHDASNVTTQVVPSTSNQGCVSWGAVIVSTTVKNSDHDGILDSWKHDQGYCDVSMNPSCVRGDPAWVDLTGAVHGQKDIFLQYDYMCSSVSGGSCSTAGGNYSFDPRLAVDSAAQKTAVDKVVEAFENHQINLHAILGNAIAEGQSAVTCGDSLQTGATCPFPNALGTVGFREGLTYIKNQNINPASGLLCQPGTTDCGSVPVFQHGKKDSYHYALFSHGVGLPSWFLSDGSLSPVSQSGRTVTFKTPSPHGIAHIAGDSVCLSSGRVTVVFAISNPNLNGTYCATVVDSKTFTITVGTSVASATYSSKTDPNLAVANGQVTSMSGFSDVGGQNSVISLGYGGWGPPTNDGNTWQVKAGTFMHELGHTLGLTHGGTFYSNLNNHDYTPIFEPNCKPNVQSVMNYQFQVDLLVDKATGHQVVDYSDVTLGALAKSSPQNMGVLSNALYANTAWFQLKDYVHSLNPNLTLSVMGAHCDGTPRLPGDPDMTYVSDAASSFFSSSANPNTGLDINYDGHVNEVLHGHDEWDGEVADIGASPGLDLQQISAVGTITTIGLGGEAGALRPAGGGGALHPAGGGGALRPAGGGGALRPAGGGGLNSDISHETANSYARPPRNLTATEDASPRTITLNWTQPTFGQITQYNIYRATGTGQFQPHASVVPVPPATSFPPTTYHEKPDCNSEGYRYEVTAVVSSEINGPQESLPSNVVPVGDPLTGCYTVTGFLSSPSSARQGSPVSITWTLNDDYYTRGNSVTNAAASTLVAVGPNPNNSCAPNGRTTLLLNGQPQLVNGTLAGAFGGSGVFTFALDSDVLCAGLYTFELDLDSGQKPMPQPALQLGIDVTDNDGPTIVTTSLPDAFVVLSYPPTPILQDGGLPTLTWSVAPGSDPLPPGITVGPNPGMPPNSGLLSGTPTTPGVYSFTLQVKDSANNLGTQAFTMRVIPPVPQINQPSDPDASNPSATPPTLTLHGMGFVPNSVVLWNGSNLTTSYVSPTQLIAVAPALARGTASISVTSPLAPNSNIDLFQLTESTSTVALSSPTTNITGTNPNAVVAADFDGDGKMDLAIANGDGSITILLGNGDGTFITEPPLDAGASVSSLTVGDFNFDGKLDLAVASSGTPGKVSVFLGKGDGTFQAPAFFTVGNTPTSVITGDFNRDGKLDLAVANQTDDTVSILLGKGDGTFQTQATYPAGGTSVAAVALGDFDGDNKLDMAVTNPSDGKVSVLLGNGDGTFPATPVSYSTGANGSYPVAVTVADLNGDGKLDLAVTNLAVNTVAILLGNGNGTFQPSAPYPTTTGLNGPGAITTGDFNGDAKVDLAITDQIDNSVSILLGNGSGTFQTPLVFTTGNFAAGVAAGDFNGDGRLDVAVANTTDGNVSVMLQRPQSPTNLATTSVTASSIGLSWTFSISSDVVSYNVYRATTSSGPYASVGSVSATQNTFIDSTVSSGTTYYYVVRAVIANSLESTNSNEVSATTPPLPPTSLMATATSGSGTVSLIWTASTSPTVVGYDVYRSITSGGPYTPVATSVATTNFTDTVASGTYFYVVTAVDASARESTHSNEASATD